MDISIIATIGFTSLAIIGILVVLLGSCGCKQDRTDQGKERQ